MASPINNNMDLVIRYLMLSSSRSGGVTASEIEAGTGLSKSTVNRCLNKHPAVKVNTPAGNKSATYWVDVQDLANVSATKRGIKIKRYICRTVDEGNATKFLNQPIRNMLAEDLVPPVSMKGTDSPPIRNWMRTFSDTYTKALAYQQGGAGLTREEIYEARLAIENLLTYGSQLVILMEHLKTNRAYTSDEHFWALWPLDNEE